MKILIYFIKFKKCFFLYPENCRVQNFASEIVQDAVFFFLKNDKNFSGSIFGVFFLKLFKIPLNI